MITEILIVVGLIVVLVAIKGFRIVRPTERGLVERFGKYNNLASPGLNWIIPLVDRIIPINITEMMIDAEPQEIITKDKLNAVVDAQVYYKIRADEASLKNSQYNVNSVNLQIVSLARTTLRNIIGTLTLNEANSERDKINSQLMKVLSIETKNWGIEVVRTELKEINPPKDVQGTMNEVVKAENEKQAAVDFATAAETVADGRRRAAIKEAEGLKQSQILDAEGRGKSQVLVAQGQAEAKVLEAQGQAQAIKLVNESANKYFIGNAVKLKQIEMATTALTNNTKYVLDPNKNMTVVLSDMAGITPVKSK